MYVHCDLLIIANITMSINIYTCSQADLQTLENIGPKYAADIISLRNEVLAGKQPQITVNHLAAIRLKAEVWQQWIDDGKLSLIFHATSDGSEKSEESDTQYPFSPAPQTDSNILSGQQDDFYDNETAEQMDQTEQTSQTMVKQHLHQENPENPDPVQESVIMLAQQVDVMSHQLHLLGNNLSQKMMMITDSMGKMQTVNTNLQAQLAHQDKATAELKSKMSVHDTFMLDVSKWLQPPVPVTQKLPIFKKSLSTPPDPLTLKTDNQNSPVQPSGQLATPPPSKPVLTQPTTAIFQPIPAATVDVKTKHPQQMLIDSIMAAIPKSAIFSNTISPVATQEISKNMTGQPTSITAQPTSITAQPTSMTGQPTSITIQPVPLTQQPTSLTGLPTSLTAHPTSLTGQSSLLTGQPTSLTGQSTLLTGQPTSLTGQSTLLTGQPTSLTGQSTLLTEQTSQTGQGDTTAGQTVSDRGRSRHRRYRSRRSTSDSSSRSNSPPPPRLQLYSGDPSSGLSWSSFIMKFDRIARRKGWSDDKKLDRLYDCLTDKALEYASRSDNRDNYDGLRQELALRFDLKEEPIAARQRLHSSKQEEDETLESYLQRIMTITLDGYKSERTALIQQVSTEAFLRGCKHKEAATMVMNESPSTIHEACKRIKTILANKKAIGGGKVSFQERVFSVEEENRVAGIERKCDDMMKIIKGLPAFYRSPSRSPSRYSSGPQGQSWSRQRSPGGYRGRSPGGGNGPHYTSPARQDNYSNRGYSPNNYQRYPVQGYPASQGYPAQYTGYPPQYDSRGYPPTQGYPPIQQRQPSQQTSQVYRDYQNNPPPWPDRDRYNKNRSPQRNPGFPSRQSPSRPTYSGSPNRQPYSGGPNMPQQPDRPRSPEAYVRTSQSVQDLNLSGLGQSTTNA